jgi:hypothetical protein
MQWIEHRLLYFNCKLLRRSMRHLCRPIYTNTYVRSIISLSFYIPKSWERALSTAHRLIRPKLLQAGKSGRRAFRRHYHERQFMTKVVNQTSALAMALCTFKQNFLPFRYTKSIYVLNVLPTVAKHNFTCRRLQSDVPIPLT